MSKEDRNAARELRDELKRKKAEDKLSDYYKNRKTKLFKREQKAVADTSRKRYSDVTFVSRNVFSGIKPTVRLGNTPGVKISDQLLNSTRGLRVEFNTRASDD